MAVASFEDLCAGFCEIAGVPAPELAADKRGLIAFNMRIRDVAIDVLHSARHSAEHAFILIDLGPMEHEPALASQAMTTLLDSNFLPLEIHPPVFGRNPVTGNAVMQYVSPLFDATPPALFELVSQGVETALRWRDPGTLAAARDNVEDRSITPLHVADFA